MSEFFAISTCPINWIGLALTNAVISNYSKIKPKLRGILTVTQKNEGQKVSKLNKKLPKNGLQWRTTKNFT